MNTNTDISPKEWMNIALGAIAGAFVAVYATHSVLAGLLGGTLGVGGAALALVLLRKLAPNLYFRSFIVATKARVWRTLFIAIAAMVAFDWFYFQSSQLDPVSKWVIVFFDIGIVLNVVFEIVQVHRRETLHHAGSIDEKSLPDQNRWFIGRGEWCALTSGIAWFGIGYWCLSKLKPEMAKAIAMICTAVGFVASAFLYRWWKE